MVNSIYLDTDLHGEPPLEDMMADPIVRLIMLCDGVDEGDMRGEIDRVQRHYQSLIEIQ